MSLGRKILLRYRNDGHVRFDVPGELCEAGVSDRFTDAIRSLEGVYRVDLATTHGKLSIRYLSSVCAFDDLVRHLAAIIRRLSLKPTLQAAGPGSLMETQRTGVGSALAANKARPHFIRFWLETKLQEIRESWLAIRILAKQWAPSLSERPRWIKEFMNDLLMLYLIKLHWHHILTEWLPRPWTHRYEWAATIYMIYLSVQSRLPQTA